MKSEILVSRIRPILIATALSILLINSVCAEDKKPKEIKRSISTQSRYTISFPADTYGDVYFDVYTTSVTASALLGHFYLEGRRPLLNGVNVFSENVLSDLKVHVSSDVYKEVERFVEESARYAKVMAPCEDASNEYYQMDALPDDNPRKAWLKKKMAPCEAQRKTFFHGYKSLGQDLQKLGVIQRDQGPIDPDD